MDATPAIRLRRVVKALADRWNKRFDRASRELAGHFAKSASERSAASLKSILKRGGFTVEFRMKPVENDILAASIAENVALIKSIPAAYFTQVEGSVMRSVQLGRDLKVLTDELEQHYGVTRRRAALIARTQNNMATAAMTKARYLNLGITKAVWMHSGGGRHPRPSHVKAGRDRVEYDVALGWLDPDEGKRIWPGQLINCLPSSAVIEHAKACNKLWRRRYDGELSVLVTDSGKVLETTPNHPVLTKRGWLPCKLIRSGDDIIGIREQVFDSVELDVQRKYPFVSEIFDTVSDYIPCLSEHGSISQFHGDGADKEIETINIDGFLPDELDSFECQKFSEFFFPRAYHLLIGAGFNPDRTLYSTALRLFSASESCIRGFSTVLPFLAGHLTHADDVGQGLISKFNVLLDQSTHDCSAIRSVFFGESQNTHSCQIVGSDLFVGKLFGLMSNASRSWYRESLVPQAPGEVIRVHADGGRSLFEKRTVENEFLRVVDIRSRDFSGQVYNLETWGHWFTSGNHIIHNCRCVARPILEKVR